MAQDYERKARAAGWQEGSDRFPFARNKSAAERIADTGEGASPCVYAESWQEACELDNL